MTVNLPPATGTGRILSIKNINTALVYADPNAVETIDDETTQTVEQWDDLKIQDYVAGKWAII
jgi:hypothetical protein